MSRSKYRPHGPSRSVAYKLSGPSVASIDIAYDSLRGNSSHAAAAKASNFPLWKSCGAFFSPPLDCTNIVLFKCSECIDCVTLYLRPGSAGRPEMTPHEMPLGWGWSVPGSSGRIQPIQPARMAGGASPGGDATIRMKRGGGIENLFQSWGKRSLGSNSPPRTTVVLPAPSVESSLGLGNPIPGHLTCFSMLAWPRIGSPRTCSPRRP